MSSAKALEMLVAELLVVCFLFPFLLLMVDEIDLTTCLITIAK